MIEKHIKQIYEGVYNLAEIIDNSEYTIKANNLADDLINLINDSCFPTKKVINELLEDIKKCKQKYNEKFKKLWKEQRELGISK